MRKYFNPKIFCNCMIGSQIMALYSGGFCKWVDSSRGWRKEAEGVLPIRLKYLATKKINCLEIPWYLILKKIQQIQYFMTYSMNDNIPKLLLHLLSAYSQQEKNHKSHYLALCITMQEEFHTCPMKLFRLKGGAVGHRFLPFLLDILHLHLL